MVTILLLGPARDAAGVREDTIEGATVGEVLHVATERYGAPFAAVLAYSAIWVNGEAADDSVAVSAHDEVAVLPPVSGG